MIIVESFSLESNASVQFFMCELNKLNNCSSQIPRFCVFELFPTVNPKVDKSNVTFFIQ